MRNVLATLTVLCLLNLTACGEHEAAEADSGSEAVAARSTVSAGMRGAAYDAPADAYEQSNGVDQSRTGSTTPDPLSPAPPPTAIDGRKIIYNASLDLAVDKFDNAPANVAALTQQYGGFIASSSISGAEGEQRHGRWTLRIPSARFDAFMSNAQTIGQLRNLTSNSQEVTAEYTDLESRIRNLRAEEERLQRHLNENTRNLDEILRVEREIARVRGEVEMYQGRLNVLKDLTSLSTVTLSVREIDTFAPPATEDPGFGTQVARAWGGSVDALGSFLTGLSLFVVKATPWLVLAVPATLFGWRIKRKVWRPAAARAAA